MTTILLFEHNSLIQDMIGRIAAEIEIHVNLFDVKSSFDQETISEISDFITKVNPSGILIGPGAFSSTGNNLVSEIRKYHKNIQIIVMVRKPEDDTVMSLVKSGASDVILHPFDPDRVRKSLERLKR